MVGGPEGQEDIYLNCDIACFHGVPGMAQKFFRLKTPTVFCEDGRQTVSLIEEFLCHSLNPHKN